MTETNFISTARGPSQKSPISLTNGEPVHGQFFGQSSLSKLSIVTEKSVVKVDVRPEDLAHLAPLSCGYLTGAGTMMNVLNPSPEHKVAVFGMGAVGLAAVMAAKVMGAQQIIAIDMIDSKLDMASTLGATNCIKSTKLIDINSAIRDVCPGGVDKIMDATGVGSLLESGVKALAHAGTLALVGVPTPTTELSINALDFLVSCKTIVGVIEGYSNPQRVSQIQPIFENSPMLIVLIEVDSPTYHSIS